jgi:hypothetical protein
LILLSWRVQCRHSVPFRMDKPSVVKCVK